MLHQRFRNVRNARMGELIFSATRSARPLEARCYSTPCYCSEVHKRCSENRFRLCRSINMHCYAVPRIVRNETVLSCVGCCQPSRPMRNTASINLAPHVANGSAHATRWCSYEKAAHRLVEHRVVGRRYQRQEALLSRVLRICQPV